MKVDKLMKKVSRKHFSRRYDLFSLDNSRMLDFPIYIGYNATMSASHVHKFIINTIVSNKDNLTSSSMLDIGTGSGYLPAVFKMLSPKGYIQAVDHVDEFINDLPEKFDKNKISFKNVEAIVQDCNIPWSDRQFDVINVGGSVKFIPKRFYDMLKPDGIMIVPVGHDYESQILKLVTKQNETFLSDRLVFGPITSLKYQISPEYRIDPYADV